MKNTHNHEYRGCSIEIITQHQTGGFAVKLHIYMTVGDPDHIEDFGPYNSDQDADAAVLKKAKKIIDDIKD